MLIVNFEADVIKYVTGTDHEEQLWHDKLGLTIFFKSF